MTTYNPDKWVIIEIITPELTIRKVLSSFYGGYTGSDSWRASSGITETIDNDDHYLFHNESGSIYKCPKHSYGMSGYTTKVYEDLLREMPAEITMTIVGEYDQN